MKYIKAIIAFFICAIAAILPYRIRILLSEVIWKVMNSLYRNYVKLINYIVKQTS